MIDTCPHAEEILRWSCGHFAGSRRGDEIEEHVAHCPACGPDLDLVQGLATMVIEEELASEGPEAAVPMPGWLSELAAETRRDEEEARRLLEAEPSRWEELLRAHPRRGSVTFLRQVAERSVWYADEQPPAILSLASLLSGLLEQPWRAGRDLHSGDALALVGLAEGVAHKTLGDHAAALASFDRGESRLMDRPGSPVHASICLARAGALQNLNRLDEARVWATLARQLFVRFTDSVGEAKAIWQLANVEWQSGDARSAFRSGVRAARMLHARGEVQQATVVLLTVSQSLIAMGRGRAAGRLLARLEGDASVVGNPHQLARVTWQQGKVRALRDDHVGALALMDRASEMFLAAGARRAAACVMLDLAHHAGSAGDPSRQAVSARRAMELLQSVPASDVEASMGQAELASALHDGLRIAEAILSARRHLRIS